MRNAKLDDFPKVARARLEKKHQYPAGVRNVLEILKDGKPHSNKEIRNRTDYIQFNARIWEARHKFGLKIVHFYDEFTGLHFYKWVKGLEEDNLHEIT